MYGQFIVYILESSEFEYSTQKVTTETAFWTTKGTTSF